MRLWACGVYFSVRRATRSGYSAMYSLTSSGSSRRRRSAASSSPAYTNTRRIPTAAPPRKCSSTVLSRPAGSGGSVKNTLRAARTSGSSVRAANICPSADSV